jgi:hypothetical protein
MDDFPADMPRARRGSVSSTGSATSTNHNNIMNNNNKRSSHRWSAGVNMSQSTQADEVSAAVLVAEGPVGDAVLSLRLQPVNREAPGRSSVSLARMVASRSILSTEPQGGSSSRGFGGAVSSSEPRTVVVNTPVHLGECVLFSLAAPAAPLTANSASFVMQLRYAMAVSRLVKRYPVEFQRLCVEQEEEEEGCWAVESGGAAHVAV